MPEQMLRCQRARLPQRPVVVGPEVVVVAEEG